MGQGRPAEAPETRTFEPNERPVRYLGINHMLLAEIPPVALFLAGLMLVISMVLRWTRRRMRKPAVRSKAGAAPHDHPLAPPNSIAHWEVDMHELRAISPDNSIRKSAWCSN